MLRYFITSERSAESGGHSGAGAREMHAKKMSATFLNAAAPAREGNVEIWSYYAQSPDRCTCICIYSGAKLSGKKEDEEG